jgi:hypothetical protein
MRLPQHSLTGLLRGGMPLAEARGCVLVGTHNLQRGLDTGSGHRASPTFTISGRREPRTNGATCNPTGATLSSRSATRRANSGRPKSPFHQETVCDLRQANIGAPGRIRTCDTGFRRAVLYPLSYEGGRP